MRDPIPVALNAGETLDGYIFRCMQLASRNNRDIKMHYDDATYIVHQHPDSDAELNELNAIIDEFILRRIKRYCRNDLGTLYKNASQQQIEHATQAVWTALTPGKELSSPIDDQRRPKLHSAPTKQRHEEHPNVAIYPYTIPKADWRSCIDISGPGKEDGFSRKQVKAIAACLDEMTNNIPEFRQLILELSEPHMRLDMEGETRGKLRIVASRHYTFDSQGEVVDGLDHYDHEEHKIVLALHEIVTHIEDRKGDIYPVILQNFLAHELFHVIDPLSHTENSNSSANNRWLKEELGSIKFEKIINDYYGIKTRTSHDDGNNEYFTKEIDEKHMDDVNWQIGTLAKDLGPKPFTFFDSVARTKARKELKQNWQEHEERYSGKSNKPKQERPFSLFERLTIRQHDTDNDRNR